MSVSDVGMKSSFGSSLPRAWRQPSQKKSVSSGVSSPLYSAHVQWSHEWHSSHCTQLSTNSGRSFSFFSMKRSNLPARPWVRSASSRSGWCDARMSAWQRLHSLMPPSSPLSSQYDQREWIAW